ncbi:MAG: hypothetical protein A2096_13475 [Spirochaetes bacterium GWF1_41_5]|nr:MAG: hypothetical protein A2096_13475 [Spirochaetes bacterium GWF1_41_5]HBE00852.1 hypothetical protein [Spirochaetia bacterium]
MHPDNCRRVLYAAGGDFPRLDQAAVKQFHIPESLLMENAGNEIGRKAASLYRQLNKNQPVVVICGPGNNGGDGLVIARYLIKHGIKTIVFIAASRQKINTSPVRREKLDLLEKYTKDIFFIKKINTFFSAACQHASLIIEALFGTGAGRALDGIYAEVINLLNTLSVPKLAADIPAGLGIKNSISLRADYTCTVQFFKEIFFSPAYASGCGKISVIKTDFPPALEKKYTRSIMLIKKPVLPEADTGRNKFSGGRVLICAGSSFYSGAPFLAAQGALCGGAQYVTVLAAGKPCNIPPACIFHQAADFFSSEDFSSRADLFTGASFILTGPGLGRNPQTTDFVEKIINLKDKTVIIDADGLYHLGKILSSKSFPGRIVITPHSGEFARLSGTEPEKLRSEPMTVIKDFYRKYKIAVILKDAASFFYNGEAFYFLPGHIPYLAKAGSGDILAGTLLAMLSLGQDIDQAAVNALALHGLAGKLASKKYGVHAPIEKLPECIARCLKKSEYEKS